MGHHALGDLHDLLVVGIGHVELELGEFRVVLEGNAFIAEVASDLVDALQPADEQALEVQLEGDSQVQVLMELLVVGRERSRRRPAVERLQDGRLHFDEVHPVEKLAQGGHHPRPRQENLTDLGVDRQVGVALPVAGFRIGEGVMDDALAVDQLFFGRRQRRQRLGQHAELLDVQGGFAGTCAEHEPGGLDEISQVEGLLEEPIGFGPDVVRFEVELQQAGAVLEVGKGGLAHDADRTQPTGQDGLDGAARPPPRRRARASAVVCVRRARAGYGSSPARRNRSAFSSRIRSRSLSSVMRVGSNGPRRRSVHEKDPRRDGGAGRRSGGRAT